MKYRLANSVYFGCLSYPHVVALYTALYPIERMRQLLAKSANRLAGVDASLVERSIRDIRTDLVLRARIANATHEITVVGKSNVPGNRRGCPGCSGKSVATPARLWYQSGVKEGGEATDGRTVQNRAPHVHAEPPGAGGLAGEGRTAADATGRAAREGRACDRRGDRRDGPCDGRGGPANERRAGGGAEGAGAARRGSRAVLARGAGRACGVEGTTASGLEAAAAEEAATGRRVGRGGGAGVYGIAGGRTAGRPDAGAAAERGVDAEVRDGAAGAGRPGGHQQVGGLSREHRGGGRACCGNWPNGT